MTISSQVNYGAGYNKYFRMAVRQGYGVWMGRGDHGAGYNKYFRMVVRPVSILSSLSKIMEKILYQ